MMLPPEARAACAKYVVDQTRHVIETFGPRTPGSEGERAAQAYIAKCLTDMGADEVRNEPFPVAAEAFMRFQTVAGWLLILGFAAYWFAAPLGLLLSVAAFVVTWFQFIHYRLFLDSLYPKTESVNVYARFASKNPPKRRIILNGHADAAFEWRFLYERPKHFAWIIRYSLLGLPLMLVAQVIGSIIWWGAPESTGLIYLGIVQALLVPSFVLALFYTDFSVTVPGANDNLTGVFLALGVAKALKDSGTVLDDTEIACLITGSEEAGLRGAKAWAAAHAGEMKDCETAILVLDTIHDLEHLTVFEKDLNGTVKNSASFSALVQSAAEACGHPAKLGTIPLGSTDAAAFSQARLQATALVAMDPAPAHFYHTRRDNWDDMDAGCLAVVAGVIGEVIQRFDQGK